MQTRYQVSPMDTAAGPDAHGAVLRIEPVRAPKDDATYECVAENGVGDAVTAVATLTVFEGKCIRSIRYPAGIKNASCTPTLIYLKVEFLGRPTFTLRF